MVVLFTSHCVCISIQGAQVAIFFTAKSRAKDAFVFLEKFLL